MNQDAATSSLPIVVDLDGTLIKTDLLVETANQFLTRQPIRAYQLLMWLMHGKCNLKQKLASVTDIDIANLPYNEQLLGWLKQQKYLGRSLVLATASNRMLAERIAKHFGIFDEVLASENGINLKAHQKSRLLVAKYGERCFDYVGNGSADLPIWGVAANAYIVSDSTRLISKVKSYGNLARIFSEEKPVRGVSIFHALRLYQWIKNILIFVPLVAAHRYSSELAMLSALLAFILFGMVASSAYLFNDLVDVSDDRRHVRKHQRPFASGNLSMLYGWVLGPTLLLLTFGIAILALPFNFVIAMAIYFCLTIFYSLYLKQHAVIDVLTLAVLYTLRIIAGAAAIDVPLSFWMLAFSTFIFLSLAFVKRYSELKTARESNYFGQIPGRGYMPSDLELVLSLGTVAAYLSVLVLAFYIQDSRTSVLYSSPRLIWLTCPLLLYWISRVWMIAHRGDMHDDPVVFALKDKVSWLVGILFVSVFALAKLLK